MSIIQSLSALALRPVTEGAIRSTGMAAGSIVADKAIRFLVERFTDQSQRLGDALAASQDRAWKTLEMALAGDSFWSRAKAMLQKGEDGALQSHFRDVIVGLDPKITSGNPDGFRADCLIELRAARKSGHLSGKFATPEELAESASAFTSFDDPSQQLLAERKAVNAIANALTTLGYPSLGLLVGPRGDDPGLIVRAARYYFRRAVEEDPKLFQGLSFALQEQARDAQDAGFDALGKLFAEQGQRLESILVEVGAVVAQTHSAVLDIQTELSEQGAQNKEIYEAVVAMQKKLDMMHSEVRPRDSLSIRTDAEREMVKSVVARYRDLPPEERSKLPALLNAIGQLELASGSFGEAKKDFAAVATMVVDTKAKAQAHMNAYKAALESRDWANAMRELVAAIKLDAKTCAPFHVGKYMPQKILGAGGFGVAFMCKHKYMESSVVVKTLFDDQIERGMDQVFTEAKALIQLAHPNIVRIQDCGFTDPTAKSRPFIVMDYFDGVSLEEYVAKHGALKPAEWAGVAEQAAQALKAAHDKGILHRDVKPANMLVKKENGVLKVLVIDFGLAMPAQAMRSTAKRSKTLAGTSIAGTLDYAAPEQMGKLPGEKVTPASDVYGFAKTACYAMFQTTQPVLKHWQSLPPATAEFLSRCLAESPKERPKNFGEVLAALAEASEDDIPAAVLIDEPKQSVQVAELFDEVSSPRRNRERDDFDDRPRSRRRDEDDRDRRPAKDRDDAPRRKIPTWAYFATGAVLVFAVLAIVLISGRRGTTVAATKTENNGTNSTTNGGGISTPVASAVERSSLAPPVPAGVESNVEALVPPPRFNDGHRDLADIIAFHSTPGPDQWKFAQNGSLGDVFQTMISWRGKPSQRGIGMHPPAQQPMIAKWRIPPSTKFIGRAVIDDSGGLNIAGNTSTQGVTFEILGDERPIWRSKGMREKSDGQGFNVNVRGVNVLELRVYPPAGIGTPAINGARAAWIDPYLLPDKGDDSTPPVVVAKNDPSTPRVTPKNDPPTPSIKINTPPPTANVKLPWKGNRLFLADLEPTSTSLGDDKKIRYGASDSKLTRKDAAGRPIGMEKSFQFPWKDNAASAFYTLDDQALSFQASVGYTDDHNDFFGQSTTFEVIGDGKTLWKSRDLTKKADIDTCRVSVEGVKELELRVTTTKNFVNQPIWLNPMLESNAQSAPTVEWKPGEFKSVGDLKMAELPAAGTSVIPEMAMSVDRKSFYVAETSGLIRRVAWGTWKEEARFTTGFPTKSLAVSKLGVLVLVEVPATELWLLDPLTLARIQRGTLIGATRVSAGPDRTIAAAEALPGAGNAARVMFLDVAKFSLAGQATDAELGGNGTIVGATHQHTLTPDGKFLLAFNDAAEIVRWSVQQGGTPAKPRVGLRFDQKGPAIVTGAQADWRFACDGNFVALIGPDGNRTSAPNHPAAEANAIFVYPAGDLLKPAKVVKPGRGASVLAFGNSLMYGNNGASSLIRFTANGDKEKDYNLPGGDTKAILVGDGGRLVVLTEKKLIALEPAKE